MIASCTDKVTLSSPVGKRNPHEGLRLLLPPSARKPMDSGRERGEYRGDWRGSGEGVLAFAQARKVFGKLTLCANSPPIAKN